MSFFFCEQARAAITVSASEKWLFYDAALYGQGGYRYGPSIILNSHGSMDAWFSSPGANGEWDYIRYRHSNDGGLTWGSESIALKPTAGSENRYSVCDPGVFKYGDYYYIGYTSIPVNNIRSGPGFDITDDVYLARSKSPSGPFENWNGSGWGAKPSKFIAFTGARDRFGAGEPSFVVIYNTLYVYCTWADRDANGSPVNQTRVYTANLLDSNWPAFLTYRGVAINRRCDDFTEDSADVKYVDAFGKFIAVDTRNRFTANSYIKYYESTDGIRFIHAGNLKNNIAPYCHNCGISGNDEGHIDTSQKNVVGYAAGSTWASWNTYFNRIVLSDSGLAPEGELYTAVPGNGQVTLEFETSPGLLYKIRYGTANENGTQTIGEVTSSPYTVTNLHNGTSYWFTVVPYTGSAEGKASQKTVAQPMAYSSVTLTDAVASTSIPGWPAANVIDQRPGTTWSSALQRTKNATNWIYVDTGATRKIARVTLVPRRTRQCYPSKLSIQVSENGENWVPVYTSKTLTLFPYCKEIYTVNRPAEGRYVRVVSTMATRDRRGGYYVQLSDIKVEQLVE